MENTVNAGQLMQIIGEKEVELILCRARINELSSVIKELREKEKEAEKNE